MKIQLTIHEVRDLVIRSYALPHTIELEIVSGEHPEAAKLKGIFEKEGFLDGGKLVYPHLKISAIKTLREVISESGVSCGLAHAKYAVEDWARFIEFVTKHGYPNMNGNARAPWNEPLQA